MHRERALIVVIALWAISTVLWLTPGILRPDAAGYYVYLTSTWSDRDLLLFNDWQTFGLVPHGTIFFQEVTRTDHMGNQWAAGSSVFWYPAFILGHLLRLIIPGADGFAPNGISLPYNIATITLSALAALATLVMGYALARKYVSAEAAGLAAVAMWFGSPLMWYALKNSLMAHAPSAFVTGAAVYISTKLTERVAWSRLFVAGSLIGLALSIRPQNAPFVLVPLFFIRREDIGAALRSSWAYAAGGVAGALPQLVVSWTLYGDPFRVVAHSEKTQAWVWDVFSRFWFVETLFSWYHGAFTWAPILIVGVIGLALLWHVDRRFALAGGFIFLFDWIANSVIDRAFWSGYSFGQRRFDNLTLFLLVSSAVALARLPRIVAWIVTIAASLWTMALFFAAVRLDLNFYQTGSELWDAVVLSMRDAGSLLVPLGAIPERIRPTAAGLFVATIVATLCTALAVSRACRWREVTLAVILAAYFAAAGTFYAYCGINGRRHIPQYAGLIAHNRALGASVGWTPASLELLKREEEFERKSGRAALAKETAADIRRVEEVIRGAGR